MRKMSKMRKSFFIIFPNCFRKFEQIGNYRAEQYWEGGWGRAVLSAFARPRSPRGTPPALALPHEGGGDQKLLCTCKLLLIQRHCGYPRIPSRNEVA